MQQFIIHSCIAFSLGGRVLVLAVLLSTSKCTRVLPFPYGAFPHEYQLFLGTVTVALAHTLQYIPSVSSLCHLPRGPCRSGCISGDNFVLLFQGMGLLTTSHPCGWNSRAVAIKGERGTRTQREVIEETETAKTWRKVMEMSQKV